MVKNKVITFLEKHVKSDKIAFISGEILHVGTVDCKLSEERGSIYGIAVKIDNIEERKIIFHKYNKKKR